MMLLPRELSFLIARSKSNGYSGKMMPMIWLVQATSVTAPGHVEIAEPELQVRTRPDQGDPASDWLCAWCHKGALHSRPAPAVSSEAEDAILAESLEPE